MCSGRLPPRTRAPAHPSGRSPHPLDAPRNASPMARTNTRRARASRRAPLKSALKETHDASDRGVRPWQLACKSATPSVEDSDHRCNNQSPMPGNNTKQLREQTSLSPHVNSSLVVLRRREIQSRFRIVGKDPLEDSHSNSKRLLHISIRIC